MTATYEPQLSEPDSYFQRLDDVHVSPLWRRPQLTEPVVDEVPHLWRWRELYPLLREAGELMRTGADAQRRALTARNPGGGGGTTHSMVAAYQMVLPGESAPAHRHTPGAIRMMLQGRGYTVVDGEEILMEPGDLVLTPGLTWHDHRNESEEPMVWLDGLDVPFVRQMRAAFQEDFPGNALQPVIETAGSHRRFGRGLVPADAIADTPYSPLKQYKWDETHAALLELREALDDPPEGTRLEYVNPLTGGHVLPTLACYAELLAAGRSTTAIRHTSSTIFCALQGSGVTVAGGQRFAWEQNDFFAVPSWTWHHHEVAEQAVLFVLSDRPMLEPFHLYREERADQ